MRGRGINQRASGDASTCSLLEQRPGGSGGILISSGDMFLTFSENKAARETENTVVRASAFHSSSIPGSAPACKPSHVRTARIRSTTVPCRALWRCLITTKMCLQHLIELPRNEGGKFPPFVFCVLRCRYTLCTAALWDATGSSSYGACMVPAYGAAPPVAWCWALPDVWTGKHQLPREAWAMCVLREAISRGLGVLLSG